MKLSTVHVTVVGGLLAVVFALSLFRGTTVTVVVSAVVEASPQTVFTFLAENDVSKLHPLMISSEIISEEPATASSPKEVNSVHTETLSLFGGLLKYDNTIHSQKLVFVAESKMSIVLSSLAVLDSKSIPFNLPLEMTNIHS